MPFFTHEFKPNLFSFKTLIRRLRVHKSPKSFSAKTYIKWSEDKHFENSTYPHKMNYNYI
jgi:hypothetical protein